MGKAPPSPGDWGPTECHAGLWAKPTEGLVVPSGLCWLQTPEVDGKEPGVLEAGSEEGPLYSWTWLNRAVPM